MRVRTQERSLEYRDQRRSIRGMIADGCSNTDETHTVTGMQILYRRKFPAYVKSRSRILMNA